MPYFFICPIYALLFAGLVFVSLALLFIKPLRRFSSYIAVGALGTFPGFVIGNLVFWLIAIGLLALIHKPIEQVTSNMAKGIAGGFLIIFFIVGLAIANIIGCTIGFFGGLWICSRFKRNKK